MTETLVAFLSDPRSYADAPSQVEMRETHMSRVFLTDHYAYKLKKAVVMDFLDYSTPDIRRRHCEAEVRLNRRLAASIYLGVIPVCMIGSGRLQLGEPGKPIDWLVHMKRLPSRYLLDQALTDDNLTTSKLEPVIQLLARFYRESPTVPGDGDSYAATLHEQLHYNAAAIRELGDATVQQRADRIAGELAQFIDSEHKLLSDRARRIVDGHGDLRPDHVYFGKPAAVIDCIEFNRDFRLNDPLDELAFLDMECRRQNNDCIGAAFIEAYCAACDDFAPAALMAFYRGKRALLRARLTLGHLADQPAEPETWHRKAAEYLDLAWSDCKQLA